MVRHPKNRWTEKYDYVTNEASCMSSSLLSIVKSAKEVMIGVPAKNLC